MEYVASQLEIADPSAIKRYTERKPTAYEHSWEIRDAYGYHDFHGEQVLARFGEFLAARAWTHAEGALALFRQATAWLRRERVLLPGASTLTRLVMTAREDANQRMYQALAEAAAGVDAELPWLLLDLLEVPEGKRFSRLEEPRKLERRDSGLGMERALERVEKALALKARKAQVQAIPANRLSALAKYGMASKAPLLKDLAEPRRTATLLMTARHLEAAAVDDALDLFDSLMATRLISPARRATDKARLAAMPRLAKASTTLVAVTKVMLELLAHADGDELDIASARAAIDEVASREEVAAAVATVTELVPDEDSWEADNRAAIAARYGVVRPFVRLLATVLPLKAAPGGRELLAEIHRMPELLRRRISQKPLTEDDLNMNLVTGTWRRAVLANPALEGAADRDAYVMCLLTQLAAALRRRDIFAYPSLRWGDPRAQLLDGAEWSGVRDDVLAGLGLTGPVDEHLAEMAAALDGGWRQLAQRIEEAGRTPACASCRATAAGCACQCRGWRSSATRRRLSICASGSRRCCR